MLLYCLGLEFTAFKSEFYFGNRLSCLHNMQCVVMCIKCFLKNMNSNCHIHCYVILLHVLHIATYQLFFNYS